MPALIRFATVVLMSLCLVTAACADTSSHSSIDSPPEDVSHLSGAGADIRQIEVAPGIYQFMTMRDSYVRQLNSVAIVNDDDVLVFDTGTRPSSARLVLAALRKITNKPVRYVVNSHWHPDHWSGNEVYAKAFPGVTILATEHTRQIMQNVSHEWPVRFRAELARRQAAWSAESLSGKQADGTPITAAQREQDERDLHDYATLTGEITGLERVYPTKTYVGHLTLRHGGREFRFLSVTGDAEGTTALYLPREKVLLTGDAVSYPIPYITPPPSEQLASLRSLAALDTDVIVPGHGPAFHDKAFLNLEARLLESAIAGVHEALQEGIISLDDIQKKVTVDELREKFAHGDPDLESRYRDRVKVLVKLAVREARDGQDLP